MGSPSKTGESEISRRSLSQQLTQIFDLAAAAKKRHRTKKIKHGSPSSDPQATSHHNKGGGQAQGSPSLCQPHPHLTPAGSVPRIRNQSLPQRDGLLLSASINPLKPGERTLAEQTNAPPPRTGLSGRSWSPSNPGCGANITPLPNRGWIELTGDLGPPASPSFGE